MLTPRADDPHREAELQRKKDDPCSFGLLSMDFSRLPGYFANKEGVMNRRSQPSEIILPASSNKKIILLEGDK